MNMQKILVVDDVKENLIAMKEALSDVSAEIITANSGKEALNLMLEDNFAVALLDVQMPEMDGYELAECMRKNKYTASVPIIFITAINKDQHCVFKGYNSGAVDYLFKPVDTHILKSKVEMFLDIYHKGHQEILKIINQLNTVKNELKKRNEDLNKLAKYDNLTSLANRYQFTKDINRCVANASRHEQQNFSVVFLDLDNFKSINDKLGHHIGDQLLRKVANILIHNVREEDYVARLGGDEFAMIITHANKEADVLRVTNSIKDTFNAPIELLEHSVYASFSIGIATYPFAGKTSEELMRNADIAMYRSKELGKNQICLFNKDLKYKYNNRINIENELKNAIANNEFKLMFQPIFNLKDKQPVGVEVFLRWHNKNLGEVSPAEFLPVAEETGLIEEIGNWVLDTACGCIQTWINKGFTSLFYAINLSSKQLHQDDLYNRITKTLSKYSFDPKYLILELTESALLEDEIGAKKILQKLSNIGVKVILDDFGTGYSSLTFLRELPIYALKIDKSFVKGIGFKSNEMITKAILSITKNLNFVSIAEGVETQEQLQYLIDNNCKYGQGYLLKKPKEANEITKILEVYHAK